MKTSVKHFGLAVGP